MTDKTTPYTAQAHNYQRAGWQGTLPLPTGKKNDPPKGYTGAAGAWPSAADVQTWIDFRPDLGNIALRLPKTILGIDVDAWGDKPGGQTLHQLEQQLGPLPATVISTSRADGASGIRLYRVPPRPSWRDPGPGIDIIHHGWRYLVVWPSIHPNGGTYRWINQTTGEVLDTPPAADKLPALPQAWIDHIASDRSAAAKANADDQEVADWLNTLPPGPPDKHVADLIEEFNRLLDSGEPRHNATLTPVIKLLRAGEQQHPGVRETLAHCRSVFIAVVTTPSDGQRTQHEAESEWRRGVVGAYQIIKANPSATAPTPIVATEPPPTPPAATPAEVQARNGLIDWAEFWRKDHTIHEWVCEPILPRGRTVSMYSPAKSGKSLLSLDVAARIATGQPILDQPAGQPQHVVYLDLEMTEDDLYDRLDEMGYGPNSDLSHLHYYLLPTLAPLDTAAGGQQTLDIARAHNADLVIIDTTSRVISGPENDSDTVLAFYRHTIQRLKADGRSVWRLDHAGKDLTLGQRGTSAKNDDVDVVWQLKATGSGHVALKATHRRVSWVPETLDLKREEWPLTHVIATRDYPAGTKAAADALDDLGAGLDISRRDAEKLLRGHGHKARTTVVGAAVRFRREEAVTAWARREPPREPKNGPSGNHRRNQTSNTALTSGNHRGNRGNHDARQMGTTRGVTKEPPGSQPPPEPTPSAPNDDEEAA